MKCSLGISNFLDEISSLSYYIVFLYFFALITEEGFLISPCYSLELCIQMGLFSGQTTRREYSPAHPQKIGLKIYWAWPCPSEHDPVSPSVSLSHQELTHWKRPWCRERLKAGGEVDDRGWDGWMASLTQWTWVWASSRSWWQTGKPDVLRSMGSQRVGHNWVTELNWTEWKVWWLKADQ